MAEFAVFGDITFEVRDNRIYTFMDMQRSTSSRWASHDVIGKKPYTEYIGPGLDTLSFRVFLTGMYGTKPREELDLWLRKARSGRAETFVVGERRLGVDKWIVQDVNTDWLHVLNGGQVLSGSVDITLEEFVEVDRPWW